MVYYIHTTNSTRAEINPLYYTKHYTLLLCGFNKDFNGTQYIEHSTFIIYWNGTI